MVAHRLYRLVSGANQNLFNILFWSKFREKGTTSGYFTVDPVLRVNSTEAIPLECVSLQTVLSKSLGPLTEWSDRLQVSTSCNTTAKYH